MKALEEKLRSTGRVSWTQNAFIFNNAHPVIERKAFWQEPIDVTADPKSCSLRVVRQSSEAKAMNHAAEICGAGADKEPF